MLGVISGEGEVDYGSSDLDEVLDVGGDLDLELGGAGGSGDRGNGVDDRVLDILDGEGLVLIWGTSDIGGFDSEVDDDIFGDLVEVDLDGRAVEVNLDDLELGGDGGGGVIAEGGVDHVVGDGGGEGFEEPFELDDGVDLVGSVEGLVSVDGHKLVALVLRVLKEHLGEVPIAVGDENLLDLELGEGEVVLVLDSLSEGDELDHTVGSVHDEDVVVEVAA